MDPQEKTQTGMRVKSLSLPSDAHERVSYFYVNNTNIFISNWEIRLLFSETLPSDKVEPRVGITISYQHAKALAEVLDKHIQKLESAMGEIQVKPKNLEVLLKQESD